MLKELKTYIVAVAIGIMSLSAAFPSYAESSSYYYSEETYNCFRIEDNYDWLGEYLDYMFPTIEANLYKLETSESWWDNAEQKFDVFGVPISYTLVYYMNIWQRKCAPYASGDNQYLPLFYSETFGTDYNQKMADMLAESSFNKAWLDENMPNIVPEGTDIDEAVRICYDWVIDNFTYKSRKGENGEDTFTWKAMTGLQTGYAHCVGHASQFRNMVNYLIFDFDNKVVYLEDDDIGPAYRKLNMQVVGGNEHAWNACRNLSDTHWIYYDPTFDDSDDGQHHYEFYGLSAEEFFDGETYMVGTSLEDAHPWIRGMYNSNMEYYSQKVADINILK